MPYMFIYNRSNDFNVFFHIIFDPVHENIIEGTGVIIEFIFFKIRLFQGFGYTEHIQVQAPKKNLRTIGFFQAQYIVLVFPQIFQAPKDMIIGLKILAEGRAV